MQPSWGDRVVRAQLGDSWIQIRKEEISKEPKTDWTIGVDGGLWMKGKLVMPASAELKRELFDEAHRTRYTVHPGTTKMYKDLKRHFWWSGMRREVADYVARCFICQQVKAEHQRPAGTLQPLSIPE